MIVGEDFRQQVRVPKVIGTQPQTLRLRAGYLSEVRRGSKRSTIRKGKQPIKPGLLFLECGSDFQVVTVTSVRYCQLKNLTLEDANDEGLESVAELKSKLWEIHPDLQSNHFVTVIKFGTPMVIPI